MRFNVNICCNLPSTKRSRGRVSGDFQEGLGNGAAQSGRQVFWLYDLRSTYATSFPLVTWPTNGSRSLLRVSGFERGSDLESKNITRGRVAQLDRASAF